MLRDKSCPSYSGELYHTMLLRISIEWGKGVGEGGELGGDRLPVTSDVVRPLLGNLEETQLCDFINKK